ncbi:MAG: hypothetical protein WD100_03335 [Tistlia sp.]|uniref:hypothetical protein n=1 Tax=Tistlia sp. TaxID=3057121 RepID=UPI0034A3596A
MRLRELRDVYAGQDIYIVGTGPSINVFPMDFLEDKICLSLNDAYKAHPAVTPMALMHHQLYAHKGRSITAPYHENLKGIRYPIVKASGRNRAEVADWDHPFFYYFDWSHEIDDIWTQTKDTDELIYMREGCSLHAALQIAWIAGASTIFTIGCDSRTLGGKHYAAYDKDQFRDDEVLKRGNERNYDAYVYGGLVIQEFLRQKGVRVISLSGIVGYHLVDYQYDVLRGEVPLDDVLTRGRE